LRGEAPEQVTLIGVQPADLSDLGGSLGEAVRERIPDAVELAARELAGWGYPGERRTPDAPPPPLNAGALALDVYESGRPSAAEACRIGDPRVLAGAWLQRMR